MTTKLILINTDTHVVVPKEPTADQLCAMRDALDAELFTDAVYKDAIASAPQLTTPPVLRWEGEWLILGNEKIAVSTEDHKGCFWVTMLQNDIGGRCESMVEARRAAEKALGLPECPEG